MKLNDQQIIDRFLQLVQIDTPSHMERPMADYLTRELKPSASKSAPTTPRPNPRLA